MAIVEYPCNLGDRAVFTFFYDDASMELYRVTAENWIDKTLHIELLTPPPRHFQIAGYETADLTLPPGQRKKYVMVESNKQPGVFFIGGIDWMAYHD